MKKMIYPFLIIVLFASISTKDVSAYELPPDLVLDLHTDLKVAYLYQWDNWASDAPPYCYSDEYEIDTGGLYGLIAYDVLLMHDYHGALTTEQINMIVNFVENGGGLIFSYDTRIGTSSLDLLEKLGIVIKAYSNLEGVRTLEKDGKMMVEHPITTGIEKLSFRLYDDSPQVVAIESDGVQIIKSPFIVLAKNFGEGRVIFDGSGGYLSNKLSGLRFKVNMIEWVAGYTPPGWSPPEDSIVGNLRDENNRLREILDNYESYKDDYEALKVNYDNLMADFNSLMDEYSNKISEYDELQSNYDSLYSDYQLLKSNYEELRNRYHELKTIVPKEFYYIPIATTILFIFTTIYYYSKSRSKL